MRKMRLPLLAAVAALAAVALAACTSGPSPEVQPAGPATSLPSAGSASTPAARATAATSASGASPAATPASTAAPSGPLSGSVKADGSSTVFPISEAVAEEFQKKNPNVRVTVGISGTGGGFKKFCAGEIDISDASRPIRQAEIDACKSAGIEYVEFQVAWDGLSVMVNPKNYFIAGNCIKTADLKAIWEPGSKVNTWADVNRSWPAVKIFLAGPGTDSGTFDYFTEAINGKEKASRSDYTASEDDNVLVQAIAGEPFALGYFGYAYYVENKDKLKLLAVDGGTGCVFPSVDTIEKQTYKPLSRPLFIYVKKESLGKPEVKAFVDYYLQKEQQALVRQVGYVGLSDKLVGDNLAKLKTALAG
ncbi:MAG: PstS family phosphate ABC transporter substrate-binding protein [Halobacteria archaeon]